MNYLKPRYSLTFILAASLLSCHNTASNLDSEYPVIDVDADFKSAVDDAGDFFDSYRCIVPRECDSIPLGNIDVLDLKGNIIAIASGAYIHVFDDEGALVGCFSHKGNGPEEYLGIQDIAIGDDCVYVLSWAQSKILAYGFTGNFVGSYDLPCAYAAMSRVKDGFWLASESDNDSKHEFALYDCSKKEIESSVLEFEKIQGTYSAIGMFNPFLYASPDETLAAKQYDYSVYSIDKDAARIAWQYRFNTPKQIQDFGEGLSNIELYQALSREPVVMWPGVLWKNGDTVYQTFGIFYIMGRFTNIYKFDLGEPAEPGRMLHVGLKFYEDFPFLSTQVLAIKEGNYVSSMTLADAKSIAAAHDIEIGDYSGYDDEAPVIFLHHFK